MRNSFWKEVKEREVFYSDCHSETAATLRGYSDDFAVAAHLDGPMRGRFDGKLNNTLNFGSNFQGIRYRHDKTSLADIRGLSSNHRVCSGLIVPRRLNQAREIYMIAAESSLFGKVCH